MTSNQRFSTKASQKFLRDTTFAMMPAGARHVRIHPNLTIGDARIEFVHSIDKKQSSIYQAEPLLRLFGG
jgi:hypothetical protein